MTALLAAALLLALLAGATGYLLVRAPARRAHVFLYFRCQRCRQKLRYQESKAGKPAICPRCRMRWVLP
jgi:DNA-directed RNA polymerase subunit RPC12/RpoP